MQAKEDVWFWEEVDYNDPFGDPDEPAVAPGDPDPDAPAGVPAGARRFRALVWPRSAADNSSHEISTQNQNTVVVGLTALLPRGAVVSPTEKAHARGAAYEVEGYAADYKRKGVMVALKRVSG